MTKQEFIAKLEGAKELTSVVSIDLVLAGLNMLEPEVKVEKVFGVTEELVEQISDRIERCLDHNSYELVDTDSVALTISYNNTIEVEEAGINVSRTMRHIDACLSEFILEEDKEDADLVVLNRGEVIEE